MYEKKQNGRKVLAMLLAVVLLIGVGAGGTLAWLSATSGTVTNTFTVGDVNIELKEHDLKTDGTLDKNEEVAEEDTYKIVPGDTQPKDPFVRVEAGSEDSWIFVQVKEVNNTVGSLKYVTWKIAEGWTQLGDTKDGVSTYYRTENYKTSNTATTYSVLKDNQVTYDTALTKGNLESAKTSKPQLIFKAFAVQEEAGDDVSAAWSVIADNQKLSYVATP